MKVDRVHKWKSNDPESVVEQQYSRETQDCHGVETVVCDDEHSPRCLRLLVTGQALFSSLKLVGFSH